MIVLCSKGVATPNIADKSQSWGKLYGTIEVFVIHHIPFMFTNFDVNP